MRGTVKWFNNSKGYGFIGREEGGDVFVHYSAIRDEGYKWLQEGNVVEFEIVQTPKGGRRLATLLFSRGECWYWRHFQTLSWHDEHNSR